MTLIRKATFNDVKAITTIYNEAILTTTATFDTEIKTEENRMEWLRSHGEKYTVVVAEWDGQVVGFASLSKWSDRCAYTDTAELSVYVRQDFRGKGIGKKLIEDIVMIGENIGIHSVLARITEGNSHSIYLHESVGFFHVGVMKEIGRKFEKLLDVYLMQKIYS